MKLNLLTGINSTGYGVSGTNIALAMDKAGSEVSLFPIGPLEVDQDKRPEIDRLIAQSADYDPTSPCLKIWHQDQLAEQVGKHLHVGFPFFELDTFTYREKSHLSKMDRLFVTSEWGKSVIEQNKAGHDVRVVPLGVDREIFNEHVINETVSLETDHTVFVNVGKWEIRKGHDFLISAFNKAFKKTDKVVLKMACYNPFIGYKNDEWAKKYKGSPLGNKIILSGRLTSQRLVSKLIMAGGDCGIFPARAEGWNLELLEMMSMCKHVIATFATAHTAYANEKNARLIHTDSLESAEDGVWFHGQGQWAKLGPDQEEECIFHLREIHRLKQSGELGQNVAGIETAKRFSWDNTAKLIQENLN